MCISKTDTLTETIKHTKLESSKLDLEWDNCDYVSIDDLTNCDLNDTWYMCRMLTTTPHKGLTQ